MYNIIQADANEPVPPVMTNVFPLKASVICIVILFPFCPSFHPGAVLFAPSEELGVVIILFELHTDVLSHRDSSEIPPVPDSNYHYRSILLKNVIMDYHSSTYVLFLLSSHNQ